jgi:hypothetical protein
MLLFEIEEWADDQMKKEKLLLDSELFNLNRV